MLGREVMLVLGALEPITWADHRNAMLLTRQLPRILNGFAVYDASIWDRFEGSVELRWGYIELIRRYKEKTPYIELHGKVLLPHAIEVMFRAAQHMATNPQDKVFGLRGLCELPIKPDYELPVRHVYAKLGVGCVYYEQFDLLLSAGCGLAAASDPLLPSWVPDWQAISLTGRPNPINPYYYGANGWLDLFPGLLRTSHMANLDRGCLLTLNGYTCDTISSVWHITAPNTSTLFTMCRDFLALSPVDPTGAPTLQSLLRAFCLDRPVDSDRQRPLLDFTDDDIDDIVPIVLEFLSLILPSSSTPDTSDSTLSASLSVLGIDPDFYFPDDLKAKFFPAHAESLVIAINISPWDDDALQRAFPALSPADARSLPIVRRKGVDMVRRGSAMRVRKQLLARMGEWMGCGYRVFRTERGYIGVGPPGVEVGDGVHVVRRCAAPIVIRMGEEKEEVAIHEGKGALPVGRLVGGCCLVGFMYNEPGFEDDMEIAELAEGDDGDENGEGERALEEYIRKAFPDVLLIR